MGTMNKQFDAIIKRAQPFARPVLSHLRDLVHTACPGVVEVIKWGMPHFEYNGMLCQMAAFKEHCAFGFWKARLLPDPDGILGASEEAMGHLGRITGLRDLPADRILLKYIRNAMAINDAGLKDPARTGPRKPRPLKPPAYFLAAIKKNSRAHATYDRFSTSAKREYVEWITEARTDATRTKRLATALAWMAEGKQRNWKYMAKKRSA
jgi:uncharacterized protein YdeI (YjbR/CyaY-like superfamily)